MKQAVTVEREALLATVNRVAGAVEKKATMPVLSHFLFDVLLRGVIRITGTDLEVRAAAECPAAVPEGGFSLCVPADKFKAALASIVSDEVTLTLAGQGRLTLDGGLCRYEFACLPGDEYPGDAAVDRPAFTFPPGLVPRLIGAVHHTASRDASKYNLCGICLRHDQGRFLAVSTDGHRLSLAAVENPDAEEIGLGFTLPNKATKLLSGFNGSLEFSRRGTEAIFDSASFTVGSRLLEGDFPDFRRVVPVGHTNIVIVRRQQIIDAITACGVVADDKGKSILIETSADVLTVSALGDTGTCTAVIQCSKESGEQELRMRFDSRYLLAALSSLNGDEAWIKYGSPDAPLLLLPADMSGFDERLEVLMPMRA